MKFRNTGLISAAVAAVVAGTVYTSSIEAPDKAYRARGVARTLFERGYDPREIPALLEQRLGIPPSESAPRIREAYLKAERHPSTRYTEHVGVLTRNRSATAVNEALAWALCYPLGNCLEDESLADCRRRADQTFIEFLTPCLERERQALSERFCLTSNGNQVALGARLRMTAEQWRRFAQARNDLPVQVVDDTTVVRPAGPLAYQAAWASLGIERCRDAAP